MKRLTHFQRWTQEHKHVLRALYAQFLDDIKATPEQVEGGQVISYSTFLEKLYHQTKYATL